MDLERRAEGWNKRTPRVLGIPWGFLLAKIHKDYRMMVYFLQAKY